MNPPEALVIVDFDILCLKRFPMIELFCTSLF